MDGYSQNQIIISEDQTIIAQCTPTGSGALALLRISGTNALSTANKISKLANNKKLTQQKSHTIHYGWIVDQNNNHIDQVMFLIMHAPKTFTGQNTVEITCHNNPFIIENIIAQAINAGARIAQNGEFTKRAVLNKKIDLIKAEAINELIHANTQKALKKSLEQIEGSFSHWICEIENDLVKALAFSEASFEFIDEENMAFGSHIKKIIKQIIRTIETLKVSFDKQKHIRDGIRIAIIGAVNAGKSSLFNTLLKKQRAIVTNIAGTTRDVIEVGMYKNGNYWTIIDTAGLRQTNDVIEKEGIKRSFNEAHQADIILLVIDQSRNITPQELDVYTQLKEQYENKIILIHNKSDLPTKLNNTNIHHQKTISISTKENKNVDQLEHALQQKASALLASFDAPFLVNKRQSNILLSLEKQLNLLLPMLDGDIQYELVSYHINDALSHLAQLTGKSISEMGMDKVFREFCVGK